MDHFLDFITDNIKNIYQDKFIKIKIGKEILNSKIIDNKISCKHIQEILLKLNQNNFNFKKQKIKMRIYKYLNLTYTITESKQTVNQYKIIDKANLPINSCCITAYLIDNINYPLEKFPNKDIYHDIINRNLFKIIIDNIFIINIIFDENCRSQYINLEIEIIKQNIYIDKIREKLKIILTHIIECLNNDIESVSKLENITLDIKKRDLHIKINN